MTTHNNRQAIGLTNTKSTIYDHNTSSSKRKRTKYKEMLITLSITDDFKWKYKWKVLFTAKVSTLFPVCPNYSRCTLFRMNCTVAESTLRKMQIKWLRWNSRSRMPMTQPPKGWIPDNLYTYFCYHICIRLKQIHYSSQ